MPMFKCWDKENETVGDASEYKAVDARRAAIFWAEDTAVNDCDEDWAEYKVSVLAEDGTETVWHVEAKVERTITCAARPGLVEFEFALLGRRGCLGHDVVLEPVGQLG